jgi:hypothetical protein
MAPIKARDQKRGQKQALRPRAGDQRQRSMIKGLGSGLRTGGNGRGANGSQDADLDSLISPYEDFAMFYFKARRRNFSRNNQKVRKSSKIFEDKAISRKNKAKRKD